MLQWVAPCTTLALGEAQRHWLSVARAWHSWVRMPAMWPCALPMDLGYLTFPVNGVLRWSLQVCVDMLMCVSIVYASRVN